MRKPDGTATGHGVGEFRSDDTTCFHEHGSRLDSAQDVWNIPKEGPGSRAIASRGTEQADDRDFAKTWEASGTRQPFRGRNSFFLRPWSDARSVGRKPLDSGADLVAAVPGKGRSNFIGRIDPYHGCWTTRPTLRAKFLTPSRLFPPCRSEWSDRWHRSPTDRAGLLLRRVRMVCPR